MADIKADPTPAGGNAADGAADGISLLTLKNPVFCCYLFWSSLLVIKMLMMSLLTALRRVSSKAFANPEDLPLGKVEEVKFHDPNVERVRRAHRNDLENVLPYLFMSLLYVATGPNALAAGILIRIATISRILHTLVYAFRPVPQPTRAIAFFVPLLITVIMACSVMAYTARYI